MAANFSGEQDSFGAEFGEAIPIETPGAVRYDVEQELTEEEQARARQNIGVNDNATSILEMNLNSMTLDDGKITYLFIAANVSSAEELAALNPATVRLNYAGKHLIFNPPYQKSITGTLKRTAEDWSTYTLDFGELGRINNTGTLSVKIPQAMMSRFTATDANELTLRTWSQAFSSETQAQMRTNIGAASADDLTAHTGNADIHVTEADKEAWDAKYDKPAGGIPSGHLSQDVEQTLDEAAHDHVTLSAHVQSSTAHFTGTEKAELMEEVDDLRSDLNIHTGDGTIHVTSADKAAWDAKYDKPATGIPDTDLADKYAGAAVAGGTADRAASIPFGQVDSTSTSTAFTATVPGITELRDGVCVFLMNGVVTSASGFTININNLGAKPAYQTLAAATRVTTLFNVNYTMLFIYNSSRVAGGCWDMFYGYNSDTNTLAYNVRTNVSAGNMNSQLYRYEILFTLPDGTLEPANNVSNKPTTYTKALTTESFNPFDPIYYYATTTAVAAGAAPSASYLYTQYSGIDLRYSFNAGSTLTAYKPVYLRCTPQGNCEVKLDGNDCVVQALPSTADGKVYIYLGKTYSTYQIWLSQNHPIYEYKGGKLKLWDGTV